MTRVAFAGMTAGHVDACLAASVDRDVSLHRWRRYRRGGHRARDHAQIDAHGRAWPLLADSHRQRRDLHRGERVVDDEQQINVAATGKVVAEGQGAMQEHSRYGVVESVRRRVRERLCEPQRVLCQVGAVSGACARTERPSGRG
jgi:hypothetical protein